MTEDLSTNPLQELIDSFHKNPIIWGKIYFPNHFRIKSPDFHYKIIDQALLNRFLAVAAPRESSKSTLLSFLYSMHQICFRKRRFIVNISNTYSKAAQTLDNLKKEFKDNQVLRKDYPIVLTRDSEGDSIFRWGDGFETRVLCKGAEQIGAIRGEKFGAYNQSLFETAIALINQGKYIEGADMLSSLYERTHSPRVKLEWARALYLAEKKGERPALHSFNSRLKRVTCKQSRTPRGRLF